MASSLRRISYLYHRSLFFRSLLVAQYIVLVDSTGCSLHGALKIMDRRPDIAEMVKNCPVAQVYLLPAKFQAYVRPDWSSKFIEFVHANAVNPGIVNNSLF